MAWGLAFIDHLGCQIQAFARLLQAHHLDTVATKHEEIIVDTHLFHPKCLGKSLAERTLYLVGRRYVVRKEFRTVWRQQSLTIHLTIRQEGEFIHLYDMQGHHVGRQTFCERIPDGFGGDISITGIIATQILTTRLAIEAFDNGLRDTIDALDGLLDLTRLYTLAIDLHHPVFTVHIDIVAVWQPSQNVVGMQPAVLVELCCTFRIFVVTLTEASLNHQFTLFTFSNGLTVIAHEHQLRAVFLVRHTHGS